MDDYMLEMHRNSNTLTTVKVDNTTPIENPVFITPFTYPTPEDVFVHDEYRDFIQELKEDRLG